MFYAVIDTNVLVSALLSNERYTSPPLKILDYIYTGVITPIYNEAIMSEYEDVLHREKFHFAQELVSEILSRIKYAGITFSSIESGETFIDKKDIVFFEVAYAYNTMEEDKAYLVTGNSKHFPIATFVVTPAQFVNIVEGSEFSE